MAPTYSVREIIAREVDRLSRKPTREVQALLERVEQRVAAEIERVFREAKTAGHEYAQQNNWGADIASLYTIGTLAAGLGLLARGESFGTEDGPDVKPPEGR